MSIELLNKPPTKRERERAESRKQKAETRQRKDVLEMNVFCTNFRFLAVISLADQRRGS